MNVMRTWIVMAVLAAVVGIHLALPTPVQAGCVADVWVYDLYAAAPGETYTRVGSYFVTVYRCNGSTNWGGLPEASAAWNAAGYYTYSSGRFWRTTTNG
jgi:hypothetical protein